MESFNKAHRFIGYFLLICLLIVTGGAILRHYQSPLLRALAQKNDETLYVAILTQPAMVAAYNPHARKSVWTTVKRNEVPADPAKNASDLLKRANVPHLSARYYIPLAHKRDDFWEQFKDTLASWRYNPLLAARAAWHYLQAYHDKRTNLSPAEFMLLAMDASRLEITDFTINQTAEGKKKKKATSKASTAAATVVMEDTILPPVEDKAPLAIEDRPLLLEVLNASNIKGAAKDLTQFLRDQNQQGLLSVDVLNYDTYYGEKQPQTRIIDYSGRLSQLKQLSTAIGLKTEIVSEKQDTAICDARILIGEDFKTPLY